MMVVHERHSAFIFIFIFILSATILFANNFTQVNDIDQLGIQNSQHKEWR